MKWHCALTDPPDTKNNLMERFLISDGENISIGLFHPETVVNGYKIEYQESYWIDVFDIINKDEKGNHMIKYWLDFPDLPE